MYRRIRVSLLPWKSNTYYIVVSACVCARAHVPEREGVSMHVHACSLAYPAWKSYAPHCDVIFGPSSSGIIS